MADLLSDRLCLCYQCDLRGLRSLIHVNFHEGRVCAEGFPGSIEDELLDNITIQVVQLILNVGSRRLQLILNPLHCIFILCAPDALRRSLTDRVRLLCNPLAKHVKTVGEAGPHQAQILDQELCIIRCPVDFALVATQRDSSLHRAQE